MPKLPSAADLGTATPQAAGGSASYNPTLVPTTYSSANIRAADTSAQYDVGGMLLDVAGDMELEDEKRKAEMEKGKAKRDKQQLAQAQSMWSKAQLEVERSFIGDSDYTTLEQRKTEALMLKRDEIAPVIAGGDIRNLFVMDSDVDVAQRGLRAAEDANTKANQAAIAWANEEIEANSAALFEAIELKDWESFDRIDKSTKAVIEGMGVNEASPDSIKKAASSWNRTVSVAKIKSMPPLKRYDFLKADKDINNEADKLDLDTRYSLRDEALGDYSKEIMESDPRRIKELVSDGVLKNLEPDERMRLRSLADKRMIDLLDLARTDELWNMNNEEEALWGMVMQNDPRSFSEIINYKNKNKDDAGAVALSNLLLDKMSLTADQRTEIEAEEVARRQEVSDLAELKASDMNEKEKDLWQKVQDEDPNSFSLLMEYRETNSEDATAVDFVDKLLKDMPLTDDQEDLLAENVAVRKANIQERVKEKLLDMNKEEQKLFDMVKDEDPDAYNTIVEYRKTNKDNAVAVAFADKLLDDMPLTDAQKATLRIKEGADTYYIAKKVKEITGQKIGKKWSESQKDDYRDFIRSEFNDLNKGKGVKKIKDTKADAKRMLDLRRYIEYGLDEELITADKADTYKRYLLPALSTQLGKAGTTGMWGGEKSTFGEVYDEALIEVRSFFDENPAFENTSNQTFMFDTLIYEIQKSGVLEEQDYTKRSDKMEAIAKNVRNRLYKKVTGKTFPEEDGGTPAAIITDDKQVVATGETGGKADDSISPDEGDLKTKTLNGITYREISPGEWVEE